MGGSSGVGRVAASTVTMNRRARFRQQKERVIPPALAGRRTGRAARITGSAPAGRKVVKKALRPATKRNVDSMGISAIPAGAPAKVQLKPENGPGRPV